MPIRDLREKYGKGKGREVVNRAIRAELVGGDDCLDALQLMHRLTTRLKDRQIAGAADAQLALDAVRRISEIMAAEIAKRYDLRG